jgi:hypothetical protein
MGHLFLLKGDSGEVRFEPAGGVVTGVIESESLTRGNKATSNPLEGGYAINDHAVNEPRKLTLPGMCADNSFKEILEKMCDNRDLLEYQGVERLTDLLILSLSIEHAKSNADGFRFTLSLQSMNVNAPEMIGEDDPAMSSSQPAISPDTRKTRSAGLATAAEKPVSVESYVKSQTALAAKKVNDKIAAARTNPSTPGYQAN